VTLAERSFERLLEIAAVEFEDGSGSRAPGRVLQLLGRMYDAPRQPGGSSRSQCAGISPNMPADCVDQLMIAIGVTAFQVRDANQRLLKGVR
jgi:hypothetical protein